MRHGADLNARNIMGFTPLHFAVICRRHGLVTVQLLVDASDDPMLKNYEGETPLHFAPDCYRYSSLYPSQLEDSAKPYVGIILSR